MKARLLALFMLLSLSLTACARSAPPVEGPPVGALREVVVFHPAGPQVQATGMEPIVLTEYPLLIAMTFEPGVDRARVESGLQVTGPTPLEQTWEGDTLTLRLPDGEAGPWTLELDHVRFRERTTFVQEVRRVRENRAQVTIADQLMEWVEPPGQGTQTWNLSGTLRRRLPLNPAVVRIQFDHPVVRKSVQARIKERTEGLDLRFEWISDQEVHITVPPTLAEARIDWTGAKDAEGLRLWTAGYTLQFDGGHQLLAVDPATGKSEALHTIPMSLAGAFLSVDRVHLALVRSAEGTQDQRVFLFDLKTGLLTDTGQAIRVSDMRLDLPLEWPTAESVKVVPPAQGSQPYRSRSFDGRWLAEVTIQEAPPEGAGVRRPVPGVLNVIDLPAGQVAWQIALHLAPAKYGATMPSLVWSGDNDWLAFADVPGESIIQALHLATGEVKEMGRYPGRTPSLWGPSGWAPENEMLAYEGLLIRGQSVEPLGMAPADGGWVDPWSPGGRFLVYRQDTWALTAFNPATGEKVALGEGFLAGWLNDGRALVVSRGGLGR